MAKCVQLIAPILRGCCVSLCLIPSPKAEPLKLWLAEQGKRAIDETENLELAFDRAREIYKAKGYPDDWIGYREKSITVFLS